MPDAGYSGTPLLKKLGVKEGMSALLVAPPNSATAILNYGGWAKLKSVKTLRGIAGGPFDYAHFFTSELRMLRAAMPKLKPVITQNGLIWASWPKKSSGVASTVSESDIRACALENGLVDVKVCAIDDTWSGLKLVIPVKDRT